MARVRTGMLGPISGRIGNVVGGSWNGIDYLRSMPAEVRQPGSESQTNQRLKFKTVSNFISPMREVIAIGFKAYAVRMTAMNAAFAYNYKNALLENSGEYSIDYPNALISRGVLNGAETPEVVSSGAGVLALSWADNSDSGAAAATDTLFYAVFNHNRQTAVYQLNAANRSDSGISVNVPAAWAGDTVHCYLGFISVSTLLGSSRRISLSDSTYAGSLVVV